MKWQLIDGCALDAAAALREAEACVAGGARAVVVYRVGGAALHWLQGEHAQGWMRPDAGAPPMPAAAFEAAWRQWRERGFVAVDAALLALSGPDCRLPDFSWDAALPADRPLRAVTGEALGIYAIVDSVERLRQVLDTGITTVQLRIKQPADADRAWHDDLRAALHSGIALARGAGARLFVNDHWRVAAELGAEAIHLGQEDLLALGHAGRAELLATGLALGISSHAVWELCRARTLAPHYIACGPVWPTTTKDMPWTPQGLDNLGWWCRVAGTPVVAIGGILQLAQVEQTAAAGASGSCVVRGLGDDPRTAVPALQAAFARGRAAHAAGDSPLWPHPTLEADA